MIGAARVVGVTGLPCAGKSLAAALVASGKIDGTPGLLLKADDIGHEALLREDVQEALRRRFGEPFGDAAFVAADPAAMRRALAGRVFSCPADLEWLEGLLHPLITGEVARRSRSAGGGRVVVEAALLFAAGMERECDRVLIVEADFPVRLARAALRGWDENELRRREERQIPLLDAAWRGTERHCLTRIDNSGSAGELKDALRAVFPPAMPHFSEASTKGTP